MVANSIQDFLENVREHGANTTRAFNLSFLYAMPPAQLRAELHDMLVVKEGPKPSKKVKHAMDMIRHLSASGNELLGALEGYLTETLEEEIAAGLVEERNVKYPLTPKQIEGKRDILKGLRDPTPSAAL